MEYHPGPLFPTPKPRPQPKPPKSLLLGLILAGCSYPIIENDLKVPVCYSFNQRVINSVEYLICMPTNPKYQIGLEARF